MENTFITTHQESRTSLMQDKDDDYQLFFYKKKKLLCTMTMLHMARL